VRLSRRAAEISARALPLLLLASAVACGPDPREGLPFGVDESALAKACPPTSTVPGIDIASYQHPNGAAIDWPTVAISKRFVIIKATEGTTYTNPYYSDDASKARAAGLVVSAYHYLRYTSTGAAQADHFLSQIGGSVGVHDLPPMLDVEEVNDSSTVSQRVSIMRDWLDTIQAATGRVPMIYSGAWYWASSAWLGTPTGFSDHPLVWSDYTTAAGHCPSIPNDFPKLTIWQFSGSGTTTGIIGDCDQDELYPDWAGKSLGVSGQSYPIVTAGAVDVQVGQTVTGWVKLENTGLQAWQPGVVQLAPIPREEASPYRASTWLSATRISSVTSTVAPGEVGQFELDIAGSAVGTQILSLGWVADGIGWFADLPLGGGPADGYFAVKVNVTAADAGNDAGADAGSDAGADAGSDAGADAGSDAGADAGSDAGADAGSDAGADAGQDGGADGGSDSGSDAGPAVAGGSGCSCGAGGDGNPWAGLPFLIALFLRAPRRRVHGTVR
jgi:MYXO-CTERM domain-containing protein